MPVSIDLSITERFFEVMLGDRWADEVLILQSFDDDADRIARERDLARLRGETYHSPRAHTRSGTWAQLKAQAQRWARDGCCVSWTLQRFEGKRRDHADYFRGIRCIALDFDSPGQPLPTFPIFPHAIVNTSPGKYHVYWRADLSREAYDRLMPVLIDTFGADANAADVCRVLRLPGFPHQKRDQRKGYEGTPHLVQLLDIRPGGKPISEATLWRVFQVDEWWQAQAPTNGHGPNGTTPEPKTRHKTWPAILPNSGPIDWPAIQKALTFLPPDERQSWLTVGMALASIAHPKARVVWDEWSQASAKYDADDQSRTWDSFKEHTQRVTEESARVGLGTLFHLAREQGYRPEPPESWKRDLETSARGEPKENLQNYMHCLTHDPIWKGRLWFDTVANRPMVDDRPLTDDLSIDIGESVGKSTGISVRNLHLLEKCIHNTCNKTPRDLIMEWLESLPPWDEIERLQHWLSDVANTPKTAYGMAVSRIIPLSMVARAMKPGCQYRYVVILEGPENIGKSKLVRALGGPWYGILQRNLDSKESHMAIQGVWLSEMSELETLTRSEENQIKAFVTMEQDEYIPKYKNERAVIPRRTVFMGTTNETSYLKGITENTRYLPIQTKSPMAIDLFLQHRDQLFAEALAYIKAHQEDWWEMDDETLKAAQEERSKRQVVNPYVDLIAPHLDMVLNRDPEHQFTTWAEIAGDVIAIRTPEGWKDQNIQRQIGMAMTLLHWKSIPKRVKDEKYPFTSRVIRAWVPRDREESNGLGP